ncbi:hypothetical protein [Flavobacterium degerlachei]|jgi:hypothetical protein|uniref:Peptidase U49 n=1 Tax=Flavobacterium degerlachei TaxID=229203 RepID=A0A1H3CZQ1_9FLAO|nr:hypothetical protein [Flavobacterium degerlachei]SDX59556.1 hypothetical protein SAMN05444338_11254 [Flavobacterium degerlachei]
MTLQDYNENIDSIMNDLGFNVSQFYDLEFSPNQSEFLNVFSFYRETLQINSVYGIVPAYLYFINNFSINAKAGLSDNGYYLIGIYMGTINWLINNFKTNETLIIESDIFLFEKLAPYTDTPINNLMYQAGLHFTFYHELAHLIQKSDYLELNLEENPETIEVFDINRHLMEIDADTFSALCLGTHIMQYSEKLFGEEVSKPLVEAMIVLFSVPIILYLLSFEGNSDNLYYAEKTHPHPAIRLTNFIIVLTHYCNQVLDGKNRGFTTDQGDIFIQAMNIAEELQYKFFDNNSVSIYRENITANRPQVISYLFELVELNDKLDTTATHKWNLRNA